MRGVVVALFAGLLLTGCSTVVVGTASPAASSSSAGATSSASSKSGPAIVVDAADALEKAGAVDIAGTMTLDPLHGDLTVQEEVSEVDVHLQGSDLTGKRVFDGNEVEMIRTGGALYERAAAPFWAEVGYSPGTASRLSGTWVQVRVDSPSPGYPGYTALSIPALVSALRNDAGGYPAGVSTETFESQNAWLLSGPGGPTEVAADGPPYPLHVTDLGWEPGDLTFTAFGMTQTITAPTGFVQLPPR